MPSLARDAGGNFQVAFRWGGRRYLRALGTRDQVRADASLQRIEATLTSLKQGWVALPEGADAAEFITSGGTRTARPAPLAAAETPPGPTTLAALFAAWRVAAHKRANTLRTIMIHQEHAARLLGADRAVLAIATADLRDYAARRAAEPGKRGPVRPYTIRKELRTLLQTWRWGARQGLIPAPVWTLDELALAPDPGREPFRTFEEIERRLERGRYDAAAEARLWACLYLTGPEVKSVLDHVEQQASATWFVVAFAIAALAGARRAEILRSEVDDWDLERRTVQIRELKRDTSKEYTLRAVTIHPRLATIVAGWRTQHPGGRPLLCRGDGSPVSGDLADGHFDRVLGMHTKWRRIRGFHTLRHSFASNLAARGVDQRVIDALMGHQTEEMRKRYQHLFPKAKQQAVDELLL